MTKEQAINILSQVAAKFVGTRAEHDLIEQALKTLAAPVAQKGADDKDHAP